MVADEAPADELVASSEELVTLLDGFAGSGDDSKLSDDDFKNLTEILQKFIRTAKAGRGASLVNDGPFDAIMRLVFRFDNTDVQIMGLYSLECVLGIEAAQDKFVTGGHISRILSEIVLKDTTPSPTIQKLMRQLCQTFSLIQARHSGTMADLKAVDFIVDCLSHENEKVVEAAILCIYGWLQSNEDSKSDEAKSYVGPVTDSGVIAKVLDVIKDVSEFSVFKQNSLAVFVALSTWKLGAAKMIEQGAGKRLVEIMTDCPVDQWKSMALLILGNMGHDAVLCEQIVELPGFLAEVVKNLKSGNSELVSNTLNTLRNMTLFCSPKSAVASKEMVALLGDLLETGKDAANPTVLNIALNAVVCSRNLAKKSSELAVLVVGDKDLKGYKKLLKTKTKSKHEAIQFEIARTICAFSDYKEVAEPIVDEKALDSVGELLESKFDILQVEGVESLKNFARNAPFAVARTPKFIALVKRHVKSKASPIVTKGILKALILVLKNVDAKSKADLKKSFDEKEKAQISAAFKDKEGDLKEEKVEDILALFD